MPKFAYLNKSFGKTRFRILDIGAGNGSAAKTKKLFPNCEYHGVDLDKNYNNNPEDISAMDYFYEMDLTKTEFSAIPNNYFDFLRMAHVIEHLYNGDKVIEKLIEKLRPGGSIYIEYPGKKSASLPSMYGTLNFYDDPSHVRIYNIKEIVTLLKNNHCNIVSCGTRRSAIFIIALPYRIINCLIRREKIQGNFFWDLLGFAEYIYAKKDI
jgi:SAM-dependent methyltransferase